MFTGIVQTHVECDIDNDTLIINNLWSDIQEGESIAVNGVCLTVHTVTDAQLTFRVSEETRRIVHFSRWVNVERAMVHGISRVGGHHVTGHVHETGYFISRDGEAWWFSCPHIHKLHMKGSIVVNGVSLTVNELYRGQFRVNLIPKTLELTNFRLLQPGDPVNLEYESHPLGHVDSMMEAFRLADTYRGLTWPNPWVGCVIADSRDQIVARGVHRGAGTPHAEAEALATFERTDGEEYTMYVMLEPCNHTGRTPPCTEAIIQSGIRRVVYGVSDPDDRVSGTGIQRLREAGVTVEPSPNPEPIRESLHPYLTAKTRRRPWCVAKVAESLDGCVALASGESMWITSEQSREHFRRTVKEGTQAIIMGISTALTDDPECPEKEGRCYVFIDTWGRLAGQDLRLFKHPSTLIFTYNPWECNVECIQSPVINSRIDLNFVLRRLWDRGVMHCVVEGGPTLQRSFFKMDYVDEVYVYTAGKMLGSYAQRWSAGYAVNSILDGVDEWHLLRVEAMGNDVLRVYKPHVTTRSYTQSHISEVLRAFRQGQMVVVMDDESRENEGDLIVHAGSVTERQMAQIIHYTTGIVCVSIDAERAQRLRLPAMLSRNGDAKGTAFTVSCDAVTTSTGVSAHDRAMTARVLDRGAAEDLNRPGHVFPLVARDGGVRERRGHTEAAHDLCRLTNLSTAAVIGELQAPDGHMMRFHECAQVATALGIPIISIQQIVDECERISMATLVRPYTFESECPLHIRNLGEWTMRCYPSRSGNPHRVLINGSIDGQKRVVTRIHSECFTGDVLGSELCDCGQQLRTGLKAIHEAGSGVLIIPADQEGRGIGLSNKVRAYKLIQSSGVDTYTANTQLGFGEDEREYSDCVRILESLGVESIVLLTSNPHKIRALESLIDEVRDITPTPCDKNRHYLEAKRERHVEIYPTKQLLTGMPDFPSSDVLAKKRIGIVRANWHHQLLVPLKDKIREHLHAFGCRDITTHVVPGSLEVVRATRTLEYDAIVWLGILIKGETAHFEYVSQAIMQGFTDLQLRHNKTIVNGIMHCYTLDQARGRCVGDVELSRSLATTAAYMACFE